MDAATTIRRRQSASLVCSALIAALFAVAPGLASAGGLSISSAELQRFAQRLNLTSAQRSQVQTVTRSLVSESDAILQKYGVRAGTCTDLGPFKLTALNGEVNTAYSRARGKLVGVLSADQLREYGVIYQQRRRVTQNSILCGPNRS